MIAPAWFPDFDPFDGTHPMQVAAEAYAAILRWSVVPIWWPSGPEECACPQGRRCPSIGKHPIPHNWPAQATTDRAAVRAWWKKYPRANVGVATGRKSGMVVLDCDPRHGSENSLEQLQAEHGPFPDGPRPLSAGGGVPPHPGFHGIRPSGL